MRAPVVVAMASNYYCCSFIVRAGRDVRDVAKQSIYIYDPLGLAGSHSHTVVRILVCITDSSCRTSPYPSCSTHAGRAFWSSSLRNIHTQHPRGHNLVCWLAHIVTWACLHVVSMSVRSVSSRIIIRLFFVRCISHIQLVAGSGRDGVVLTPATGPVVPHFSYKQRSKRAAASGEKPRPCFPFISADLRRG